MLLGVRWGSLQMKIVAWTLVPTAIILLAVSLVAVAAFRHITTSLVADRSHALIVATADDLATALSADLTSAPSGDREGSATGSWAGDDTSTLTGARAVELASVKVHNMPSAPGSAVYIVDEAGRAVVHTDPALEGLILTSHIPTQRALAGGSGTIRVSKGPGEVIVSFAPVPGTAWLLIAEESWSPVGAANRRLGAFLLALLLLGLALPVSVVAVGARRMTLPIRELIVAAQEVAKGNFGRTIRADTGDEIEELAHEFSIMSKELEASYRHLEQRVSDRTQLLSAQTEAERRRAEQFRVIAEVGRRMTTILPVDQLLDEIARLVQETFGYYHVGIALVDGEMATYRAGAGELWARGPSNGADGAFGFSPASLRVGEEGVTGTVAGTGEALLVPDVSVEPRYVRMEGSATCSELAVPIIVKGQVIGVIDVQSDELEAFDESDLTVMQSLANQAGIAIENARLYEQARQLAVLEERQRVARDLHDSVTQSLYGVTLYADAAGRLLDAGDVDQAAGHVVQLKATSKAALQEMRLLIFELRPPELEKVGLVPAVQARLDAVEGRAGLKTSLRAEGVERAPPKVEDTLYRIIQEALNNALKHAVASTVHVTLEQGDASIRLEVIDDGSGFDVAEARVHGGIGLHSMEERAHRMGGQLDIVSAPGEGTHIYVEVPL